MIQARPADTQNTVLTSPRRVTLFEVEDYTLPSSKYGSRTFEDAEACYIRMVVTKAQPLIFFLSLSNIASIDVYGCSQTGTPDFQFLPSVLTDQTLNGLQPAQGQGKKASKKSKQAFPLASRLNPNLQSAANGYLANEILLQCMNANDIKQQKGSYNIIGL